MSYVVYLDKFEALSLREKVLIGCTVGVFTVSILQFFLIDPRLAAVENLERQIKNVGFTNQRLQTQLQDDRLMPKRNRQRVLDKEIATAKQQLDAERETIERYTESLVPAENMSALLQNVLASDESVSLTSLRNIAPIPMLETPAKPQTEAEIEAETVQLYRHGLEMQLEGDYHSLRRYLARVEDQPWQLLWHGIQIESENGSSRMLLKVQTLSTDATWLGI